MPEKIDGLLKGTDRILGILLKITGLIGALVVTFSTSWVQDLLLKTWKSKLLSQGVSVALLVCSISMQSLSLTSIFFSRLFSQKIRRIQITNIILGLVSTFLAIWLVKRDFSN